MKISVTTFTKCALHINQHFVSLINEHTPNGCLRFTIWLDLSRVLILLNILRNSEQYREKKNCPKVSKPLYYIKWRNSSFFRVNFLFKNEWLNWMFSWMNITSLLLLLKCFMSSFSFRLISFALMIWILLS